MISNRAHNKDVDDRLFKEFLRTYLGVTSLIPNTVCKCSRQITRDPFVGDFPTLYSQFVCSVSQLMLSLKLLSVQRRTL